MTGNTTIAKIASTAMDELVYLPLTRLLFPNNDLGSAVTNQRLLDDIAAHIKHRIKPTGLLALSIYGYTLYQGLNHSSRGLRMTNMGVALALNIALSLHKIPGFNNPRIINNEIISTDAIPFTMYVNLDKALAALITLALTAEKYLAKLTLPTAPWLKTVAAISLCTTAPVLFLACKAGLIKQDIGFKKRFLPWLMNNLICVCPAEEATFRLLIQAKMSDSLGAPTAILISAALFGLAHLSAGKQYAGLATLAGIGYGIAFEKGGVTASIAVHLALNLTQFLGGTYPMLQPKTPATTTSASRSATTILTTLFSAAGSAYNLITGRAHYDNTLATSEISGLKH